MLEKLKKIAKNKAKKKSRGGKTIKTDPFVKEIEENLMSALGTKVKLISKKRWW